MSEQFLRQNLIVCILCVFVITGRSFQEKVYNAKRHCEERSDEAISCNDSVSDCFAAARNDNKPVNVSMKRYN